MRRLQTSINPLNPGARTSLTTEGIFRFSRNPMHLRMLSILCGAAFWSNIVSSLHLIPCFILTITLAEIMREEGVMDRLVGDE
ncbi:MAG: hypothetical protein CMK36_02680 [Porticoccaceae bacterium]|nr:hypothetical protein [Porticoccaceae bacterium]